ncbi:hypothetical protein [Oricola nitratireducens]|uniref:hypothetical protein n=1 Tax=Oricola nitratireducens TaxID=2775868 RepID=UPI001865ED48|nr:hypothetical protein [Oricola nitratireducens]
MGVYPTITALQYVLGPMTAGLPVWERSLIFTPLMVASISLVVAPFVTKKFAGFIAGPGRPPA